MKTGYTVSTLRVKKCQRGGGMTHGITITCSDNAVVICVMFLLLSTKKKKRVAEPVWSKGNLSSLFSWGRKEECAILVHNVLASTNLCWRNLQQGPQLREGNVVVQLAGWQQVVFYHSTIHNRGTWNQSIQWTQAGCVPSQHDPQSWNLKPKLTVNTSRLCSITAWSTIMEPETKPYSDQNLVVFYHSTIHNHGTWNQSIQWSVLYHCTSHNCGT